MRRVLSVLSALLLVTLTFVVGGVPANAADPTADLQIQKSVDSVGPHGPGDTFSYSITVGCSSTNELGCFATELTDVLPEPLVFDPDVQDPVTVSLSPAGTAGIEIDDNGFTVRPQHALGGDVGLRAGGSMTITVAVMVPMNVSADYDGETITNTATVVADNADEQPATVDVTLAVVTTLEAGLTKTVAPATVGALPGKPVAWTLRPSNQSNQTVDTIVVEDVFDGTNQDHLDFVSVDPAPAPETTDSTTVEYLVEGS